MDQLATDQAAPEHPTDDRFPPWVRVLFVVGLLYLFLVGIKALETGIKSFGSEFTDSLFASVSNPIAGLFVGTLATVLVQSSSVTTATIVGLVGAGSLPLDLAVPMIMGANIGTTVTNTLASLGFLRRTKEFRLAFAGATMHDFFNLLAVGVMLPLELATGFLTRLAERAADILTALGWGGFEKADSPIKSAVKAPVKLLDRILESFNASENVVGIVMLIFGLGLIFFALAYVTRNMRLVMAGRIERSINTVLMKGGGLSAIAIGIVITVMVQSSSITTSVLVPMIAAGVVTLRSAFPITLGANIGTTITAMLASLASESEEGLVIGLVHFFFNTIGVAVFYSIPILRPIPVKIAERLAVLAEVRKSIVVVYVVGLFIVVPIIGVLILQ
ncbi:MAG: Na/Pi symporter [Acidimicrobiia bacterium]|nr:Na/Pi symporter [Acidimicrobiia bacterium]